MILLYYISKTGLTLDYVMKMSVKCIDELPILNVIPQFYRDIFLAFNKCKTLKGLKCLNKHEVIAQPIWGNSYFKVGNTCLYFKEWIMSGILYIKDLISDDGIIFDERSMADKITNKRDILQQLYIVKNIVIKKIKRLDISIAPYVKIKKVTCIVNNNGYVHLNTCKSRDFYKILISKCKSRGSMESIYSRRFNIHGSSIWQNIYSQKVKCILIPKLAEFNFKILHNILPNGYILNKWNSKVSRFCELCNEIETTEHMLYECNVIRNIWNSISNIVKINITWKSILCGFPGCDVTDKINILNYIICIVSYTIFKVNSKCKFEDIKYVKTMLHYEIRKAVKHYGYIMDKYISESNIYKSLDDCLSE